MLVFGGGCQTLALLQTAWKADLLLTFNLDEREWLSLIIQMST